jgi:hypothetical protein
MFYVYSPIQGTPYCIGAALGRAFLSLSQFIFLTNGNVPLVKVACTHTTCLQGLHKCSNFSKFWLSIHPIWFFIHVIFDVQNSIYAEVHGHVHAMEVFPHLQKCVQEITR